MPRTIPSHDGRPQARTARRIVVGALHAFLLALLLASRSATAASPPLLEVHAADLWVTCGFCGNPATYTVFSASRVGRDGAFTVQVFQQGGSPSLTPLFSMDARSSVLTPAARRQLASTLDDAHAGTARNCHLAALGEAHLVSRQWLLTWHGATRTHSFIATSAAEWPSGSGALPACAAAVEALVGTISDVGLVGANAPLAAPASLP